jgi:enoyl-CoA hydratase
MTNPQVLLREDRGSVAILTLNRPEKLNALNYELVDSIVASLDAIEADERIAAVILTGAGRAFSAEADIREFSHDVALGPQVANRRFVRPGQAMTGCIESFSKPVIAAVNGIAYGGGCEIVEATHLPLSQPEARFAKAEIALGMPPCFGGTQRLPRLIGRKRALQMILTSDSISAEEAQRYGLINGLVPADRLIEAAIELAGRITRFAPEAVSSCLHAVTRGLNTTISEGAGDRSRSVCQNGPNHGAARWPRAVSEDSYIAGLIKNGNKKNGNKKPPRTINFLRRSA